MSLEIVTLSLGPMDNNTYLLADPQTRSAVVIDPSFESQAVLDELQVRAWDLTAVWLTHAHFDHIAGVAALAAPPGRPPLPLGLHPGDLPLYRQRGGARIFGMSIEPGPEPSLQFEHGQLLTLGGSQVEVRHAPGHSPGHVIFYLPGSNAAGTHAAGTGATGSNAAGTGAAGTGAAICGDVIFYRGIGRTDLPGASHSQLIRSIQQQVLTLPPNTRLLPGHGPETTVAEERSHNPFLP